YEGKKSHHNYINTLLGPGATTAMNKAAYAKQMKDGDKKLEYLESVPGKKRVIGFGPFKHSNQEDSEDKEDS
ncbi:MAG: hypothetical protein Q8L57_01735, partial [bacterium]|nr:hypothetical protein [bacterium]